MAPPSDMPSVLFVCLGNICRSAAAEGLMQKLLEDRGLASEVYVDSAGTIGFHAGERADRRMRKEAERRGYELLSRSRQVDLEDLRTFDLVLAMDRQNLQDLRSLKGSAPDHVRLLSDFLPPGSPEEIPDPYYGGPRGFDVVLDLLEVACPQVLEHLLELP